MQKYLVSGIVCLIWWFSTGVYAINDEAVFPARPLSIVTAKGRVDLTVEIATTKKQQEYGLMYRKTMGRDHGMLFVFDRPRHIDMWMKNTSIPLDMVFMDNKGIIRQIVKNATPESTDIISSVEDVQAVLEVNGGATDYYHISEGDRAIYPIFK